MKRIALMTCGHRKVFNIIKHDANCMVLENEAGFPYLYDFRVGKLVTASSDGGFKIMGCTVDLEPFDELNHEGKLIRDKLRREVQIIHLHNGSIYAIIDNEAVLVPVKQARAQWVME